MKFRCEDFPENKTFYHIDISGLIKEHIVGGAGSRTILFVSISDETYTLVEENRENIFFKRQRDITTHRGLVSVDVLNIMCGPLFGQTACGTGYTSKIYDPIIIYSENKFLVTKIKLLG